MVVGYSLGNRNDQENDILVLGEDDPDVIAFSKALPIVLTKICGNACPYCGFSAKDDITVPYSTIKSAKASRQAGSREALFISGERPDKFPHIKSLLDLWGFDSYLDYAYTVCELAFLEGLIPVIDVGFLTPQEMKKMSEICALIKIMIDTVDCNSYKKNFPKSAGKKIELRAKSLDWAGKLKFPTVTGILVGIGETKEYRKEALNIISDTHKKYGIVHEVIIQNFVAEKGTFFEKKKEPSKDLMLKTVEMALEILPSDVKVIVPLELNPDIEDFIRAGVRDLGRIYQGSKGLYLTEKTIDWQNVNNVIDKLGFRLQQRFPLRKSFIKAERYSKKLGQVFDSYRYKIKKEEQEKAKETK
ncbi:MAG: 7,8-didemethyl-8-hydroxy-5-deazariboflavin synthase subunit CofG [bacterium]|nr:7,8-didemethyl-8-hydroxy-5-deazariboflavin synthase subunit CofG [bacterium]